MGGELFARYFLPGYRSGLPTGRRVAGTVWLVGPSQDAKMPLKPFVLQAFLHGTPTQECINHVTSSSP
jgi:hypothetical protein